MDLRKRLQMVELGKKDTTYGYRKVEGYNNLFDISGSKVKVGVDEYFGIIYDDEDYVLIKHGRYEVVKGMWEDKYKEISIKTRLPMKLLKIPQNDYGWVNMVIEYSSTSWIKYLEEHLNTVEVEVV